MSLRRLPIDIQTFREIREGGCCYANKATFTRHGGKPDASVNRSKVEPIKELAKMTRAHLEGIVAWAQTHQTNGFIESLNGLFQAAKRKVRGCRCLSTLRTVFFLIAGKLDFAKVNPHAAQPITKIGA